MAEHTAIQVLQLSISPVILISACGMLLLVMTNRLSRAIDRARAIAKSSETDRRIRFQKLLRRVRIVRSAILLTSISILLTGVLVLPLFLATVLPFDVTPVCAILFVSSILSLIVGILFFIVDVFLALRDLEIEGEHLKNDNG